VSPIWPAREISIFRAGPHTWELGRRTLVMGILNCTPDSFSDGGRCVDEETVTRRLLQIVEEGANIVDIGGESTRPGAAPVDADEEWRRILPALRAARREKLPAALSVDTMKPEVGRRALAEGAVIWNDVSGLRTGPHMASLAAEAGAAMILMHMQGEPRTMQLEPHYGDLLGEVRSFLADAVATAIGAGVTPDRILVDPGIGFGKTLEHNLELLRNARSFHGLGSGVVIGTSRKAFIGKLLGDLPVDERLEGSLASFVAAVLAGAHVVRVHDVRAAVRAVKIADAARGGG
jgi:dihydropteroate synthase